MKPRAESMVAAEGSFSTFLFIFEDSQKLIALLPQSPTWRSKKRTTNMEMVLDSLNGRERKEEPTSIARRTKKYTFICLTRSKTRLMAVLGLRENRKEIYLSAIFFK
jgi:hypothetical protein